MPSGLKGPAMDFVFWIIVIVLIVGIVWWLLNRSNSANKRGATPSRTDGGLVRRKRGSLGGSRRHRRHPQRGRVSARPNRLPRRRRTTTWSGRPAPGRQHRRSGSGIHRRNGSSRRKERRTQDQRQPAGAGIRAAGPRRLRKPNVPRKPRSAARIPVAGPAGTPAAQEPTASPERLHAGTRLPHAGMPPAARDRGRQAEDEWETQWSEAGGRPTRPPPRLAGAAASRQVSHGRCSHTPAEPAPAGPRRRQPRVPASPSHRVHGARTPPRSRSRNSRRGRLAGDLSDGSVVTTRQPQRRESAGR